MKGVRFYLEFDSPRDKRKGKHNGNVFAAFADTQWAWAAMGKGNIDGFCAVMFYPNSEVCYSTACLEYLQTMCKRIPEQQARTIHPRLFERLDDDQCT